MKTELEGLRRLLEWEYGAPDSRNRFNLQRTKAEVWYVDCFIHGIEVGHKGGLDLNQVVEKALYLTHAVDGSVWDRVAKCLRTDKSRKFICGRGTKDEWSFCFYGEDYLGPKAEECGPDPQKALEALLKPVEDWDRSRATPTASDPAVTAALEAPSESDLVTVRRFVSIKEIFKTACDKTKAAVLDRLLEIHARLGSQEDDPDGNKTARCVLKFLRGPEKDHSQEINRLRGRLSYQFQLWIES